MRTGWPTVFVLAVLIASCSTPPGSPPTSPSASPTAQPTTSTAPSTEPSTSPTTSPTTVPSASPSIPVTGSVVVTVSDRLRMRSAPRVSDDSLMYDPLLPLGTTLSVIGGPVEASGYTWIKVTPVTFAVNGPGFGWVAIAARDGAPWVGPASGPLAQLALAYSAVDRAAADPRAAKAIGTSLAAFGVDLYRQFPPTGNLIFSPASVGLAFGMARAGAKGGTATEIDHVFHTTGWDAFGSGLNALDQALAARNATWMDPDGLTKFLAVRIANAVFVQRNWAIEQQYLDTIGSTFGAGVRLVDYAADHEAARLIINRWVSDRTQGRIPELLVPANVTGATRLYLVNAVYLKGEWQSRFATDATRNQPFTRPDGSQVSVATMSQSAPLPYASGSGWKATSLDIRGGLSTAPLTMTLILPDDFAAFGRSLTSSTLGTILAAVDQQRGRGAEPVPCSDPCGCHRYSVDLSLPKFGIETKNDLSSALERLGMRQAFDGATADFTGIRPARDIYISAVIHQANIDVDENGCEAAAATAIGFDTGGCTGAAPARTYTVKLDRPFLFVVRDLQTGAILFMGRIIDPSAKS